jgi:hypothetical protein
VGIDEEKLKKDLFESSEWTSMPRTSATRSSVEERYRQVIVDDSSKEKALAQPHP